MSELPCQLQFKDVQMQVPRYRFARIPLNNLSAGTVTINPTSSTLCEWKLPAQTVFNLSKSFIQYQLAIPASASNYGIVFADGCDFRDIYFGDAGGKPIVQLTSADSYVNALRPFRVPIQDFLGRDQLSAFYPCNQPNTSNVFPFSLDGLSTGTQNASTRSYTENQHLEMSTNVNTAITVSRHWKLSDVVDTFLSMDKDVVFNTDMYLRMQTQYGQRIAFFTVDPGNPNSDQTAISASFNMSNVFLFLAIEENLEIRNSLVSALAAGKIRMSVPYTFAYRFSNSANASNASNSLTLTKNYGKGLKRIAFVPYEALEYTCQAYNHSNVNGTKISQIQSTLDGRPLTLVAC